MQAMELFGEAMYDYHKGNLIGEMEIVMEDGTRYIDGVKWYFRDYKDFDSIEKTLFNNISGKSLLDIGCATGYYFPEIEKRVENFEGIDISKKAILVAQERGYKNVKVADIMNYKTNKKYDILTLVGNNLSIGGTIEGTHKLIEILKGLLNNNGKMLCIFRKIEEEYFISKIRLEYKSIISEPFYWIRIRIDLLENILNEHGLKLKILDENDYGYCLEIKKI
ncbi:MAG: methyltransferase domain-containing protein [Candidatus Gracilibacteria bacterium]|nr:methyltransferase domain-containing protein [Candidatus Gracilibacteria bacterium]